jgi:mannose-6-phosphate isomerase-like protein (cupin superfamily)
VPDADRELDWPDGAVYRIVQSTEDSRGESLTIEWDSPAGAWAPPPHFHEHQTERYEVLDGSLDVKLGGEWQTLAAGQSLTIESGTVHTFRISCPARVRNTHTPALDFEGQIRCLQRTFKARDLGAGKGPRAMLYLSLALDEYPESVKPASAGARVAVRVMARLARLLGLKTA